jgi:hypothetical protein
MLFLLFGREDGTGLRRVERIDNLRRTFTQRSDLGCSFKIRTTT